MLACERMRLAFSLSLLVLAASSTTGCLVYSSSLLEELEDGEGMGGDVASSGGAVQGTGGEPDLTGGTSAASGGDTGVDGTGGVTGGTGGTEVTALESMLDDFNDQNAFIELEAGRNGSWMTYNDMTEGAVMSPGPGDDFVPELREDSDFALHSVATGFTGYGIGYFVSLSEGTGVANGPGPYDLLAEGYNAIRFSAKRGAGKAAALDIAIADETSSTSGSCPVAPIVMCAYDHARGRVLLTEEWTEFTLLFSDMAKKSSPTAEFDKAYEFHILQKGEVIDFWIDDIRFVEVPEEE
jgi:hypothetical protein